MADKAYSRPMIPLVLSLIAGISAGAQYPDMTGGGYVGLAGAAAVIAYLVLRQKYARLTPLLAFFLLGYISIQPWVAPKFPTHHIIHHCGPQKWQITGKIVSQPKVRGNRSAFILAVETLDGGGRHQSASGRIRVTTIGTETVLRLGDRIVFESRLRRTRKFNNPGGFDYERYLAFDKVWVTAYCQQTSLRVMNAPPPDDIHGLIERARCGVNDLIDRLPSDDHRAVLAALILGDRNRLTAERIASFHRVGIGHLLAISGLHIGIVAATVFFLISRSLSWFPWFLWTASCRKWAAIGALPAAMMYALLSGLSPSTQRALAMVGVFLLTFLVERDQDLLNSLSVAALALLIIHPPVLFSISFQFSFIAVLAIITGMACFQSSKISPDSNLAQTIGKKMVALLLVSLCATMGTLPLAMYYFNQVSLIGILANGVFVPMIGFGVVPCALLAVVILPASTQVAEAVLHVAAIIVDGSLCLVDWLSPLPFAAIRTVTPSLIEISCYGLFIWVLVRIVSTQRTAVIPEDARMAVLLKGSVPAMRATVNYDKRLWIVLAVVLATMSADIGYWMYQRLWRQDLRVTILDVGQGSAVLLELPGGACMLVDGGGTSDNTVFDIGSRIIAPFLWQKKIQTIETIVLTHPNSDHLNGLLFIAENFRVKQVLTNGEAGKTSGYRHFLRIIKENDIIHPVYRQAIRTFDRNGVQFDILHPPPDFQERTRSERWRNLNNNSIVMKATHGRMSFLFPGDITAKAEEELLRNTGEKAKSTVLVIPHHGSNSSSTPDFVRAIQPAVGIVTAGWQNRYGFPHPAVVDRYNRQHTRLLRTDTDGAIQMTSDGRKLAICTVLNGCD